MDDLLFIAIVIGVVAGLVVGYLIVHYMASGLISVRPKTDARDYVVENSMEFDDDSEVYLYSRTERTAKPKPQNKNN